MDLKPVLETELQANPKLTITFPVETSANPTRQIKAGTVWMCCPISFKADAGAANSKKRMHFEGL